jgi:hypothetical protein
MILKSGNRFSDMIMLKQDNAMAAQPSTSYLRLAGQTPGHDGREDTC